MMIIDLHVHTSRYSSCASQEPDEMIAAARAAGLDGVVITEHERLWPAEDIQAMSYASGLLVIGGIEIYTTDGDLLVIGLDREITGLPHPELVRRAADGVGAVVIAAHPWRGFSSFGPEELEDSIAGAASRPLLKQAHAIEVCNGRSLDQENEIARQLAAVLGKPAVGGSDAHTPGEVGRCATRFEDRIEDEAGLIRALKHGRYAVEKKRTYPGLNS
jgi:predicted metal-dependent phosphoesterase TrpH